MKSSINSRGNACRLLVDTCKSYPRRLYGHSFLARFQRHSNSIDLEKQGCFCGSRLQPQFQLPAKKTVTRPVTNPPSALAHENTGGTSDLIVDGSRLTLTLLTSPYPLMSGDAAVDDLAAALTSMRVPFEQGRVVA